MQIVKTGISLLLSSALFVAYSALAQNSQAPNSQANTDVSKFRQLGTELPTPNTYRSASGAPGHEYWQQKADYVINVTLNEDQRSVTGAETITYFNNSPDQLDYLWLQLDQNIFDKENDTYKTQTSEGDISSFGELKYYKAPEFDGGYKIRAVTDAQGKKLPYTVVKTMMRIDLPTPLKSGAKFVFNVEWFNFINEDKKNSGRGGYEFFPEDGNCIFEMAQWFPRMAVYDDVWGWQHKQYLGRGEFALTFGDYKVNITVPSDHIVAATGELQNTQQIYPLEWRNRFTKAEVSNKPVLIVTPDEALKAEKSKSSSNRTWTFLAKNVRDFAWASSRKFIWDAMQVRVGNKKVWAMSYYPKEGNPLWGQYSTQSVAHTLKVYSKHTIDYPYPVAISVNGPVGGMEYPMICFNGPRPDKDGTYSEGLKYALISVVIHEVGHNFFPMIINSDERQWSWMDEGLNTFMQYLAEQEWDKEYPSRRGEPYKIIPYMKSDKSQLVPIMVNSESAINFGNNAYGKPATALNILRETVMGRELFDHAFKSYSKRWAFKHPNPADFFRSMEDASGIDLDWFWRGWFYTTDPCDINLKEVKYMQPSTMNPEIEKEIQRKEQANYKNTLSYTRNQKSIPVSKVEENPDLKDFYNSYDQFKATPAEKRRYEEYKKGLTDEEKAWLTGDWHIYKLKFENSGGLVMPIILKAEFENGGDTLIRIPAEVWRLNDKEVSKYFLFKKPVNQFLVDPMLETADIDTDNNAYPKILKPTRFQLIKAQRPTAPNPMKEAKNEASGGGQGTAPAGGGNR